MPPGRVEVQGHRIAGRLAPENSLAAVVVATRLGVDSVEFDVRRTKDGVLVVSHGPEMPGIPHGVGVEQIEWARLRELELPGSNHEHIPKLQWVVAHCLSGHLFMNVEIKTGHAAAVPDVLRLMEESGAKGKFVISSFDRNVLKRVFALDPTIGVGALYNPALGPGQRMATPPDFATWFPPPERGPHPLDSVNLSQETVTPAEIAEAKRCGKRVMLWFGGAVPKDPAKDDTPERLGQLVSLGADVICTNRPDTLLRVLGRAPVARL
eukprot:TRINITY_DN13424_c0_g1_i1.p2 TRINITY_DN13424_c0_g1~~TRINITY_DN13424_c0_g1_i1.p2  ORF type:complete len:294 (+),score=85.89 TRINITY_DN13424_c0_g1_i1:85-882(+)